jgi:cytidyltransferase-like protein
MKEVISLGAPIIPYEEFAKKVRGTIEGTLVATSVGADPIHPGHISCIQESAKHGDVVAVIVNGDWFLENKKGKAFQSVETRCMIISALKGVDYVLPFEIEGDSSVAVALDVIKPDVFTKGGDRSFDNLPKSEQDALRNNKIEFVDNVGLEKLWSSSDFLGDWEKFCRERE